MHEFEESFVKQEIEGFQVIRDDLYEGGTKRRAFRRLIPSIDESELVYACDYYGHAAYAIALTAREAAKKVMLFYYAPKHDTEIFRKATEQPHVQHMVVDTAATQVEVSKQAIAYAEQYRAKFLPIGLDFPEFGNALEAVVKSANIDAPELWCMGGSGTLGRALQRAYPKTPVHIVSVGTANFNGGSNTVYQAPEKLNERALLQPPYPSSPQYDAKTWQFVLEHAKKGACIWNVA
jgi:hypothetical protein